MQEEIIPQKWRFFGFYLYYMENHYQTFFVPFFRITSSFLPQTDFFGISHKKQVTPCNLFTDDTKFQQF